MPRSRQTTVTYLGAQGSSLWVVALTPTSKAAAEPSSITATSATLDTSRFEPSDGSISLSDPSNFALQGIEGSQFQAVSGSARRMTMVAVVWV